MNQTFADVPELGNGGSGVMQELYEKVGTALLNTLLKHDIIVRGNTDKGVVLLADQQMADLGVRLGEVACKVIIEEVVQKQILRQGGGAGKYKELGG
jgi:hypothetical protein